MVRIRGLRRLRRWLRARSRAGSPPPELAAWVNELVDQRLGTALSGPDGYTQRLQATSQRANDAHRLAVAAAHGVEHLLQAEVELWQAIDAAKG